jgi:HAD superfamily hydrolase (TIGR01509 family)
VSVEIHAVVFDFDGLVLDTELPVYTSWCAAFEAHGAAPPTIEEWSAMIGTADAVDMHAWLAERADRPIDRDAMDQSRRAHRDALLEVEVVRPGVLAWLAEADAARLRLAIASSSPADWVDEHLGRLGLTERFAVIVTAGGALRGKPAPDVYLEACARLGVDPAYALAVEDSPNGIAAAKAAGLRCVNVPNELTARLDRSAADVRLSSLADCTLADVLRRIDASESA